MIALSRFRRCLFALGSTLLPWSLLAVPAVSNVVAVQEPDGAGATRVRVTYDLASVAGGGADVALHVSIDGGASFPVVATGVAGDVGPGVAAGTGRTIVWSIAGQFPSQSFATVAVRVVAQDATAPIAIGNAGFELPAAPEATVVLGAPPSWQVYNAPGINGGSNSVGIINCVNTDHWVAGAPQGSNAAVVFLSDPAMIEAGLQQPLAATVAADALYTLEVQIGNIDEGTANFGYFNLLGFPGYRVDLMSTAGTVIASDNNSLAATIPEGEFRPLTLSGAVLAGSPVVGQTLMVRLVNLDIAGPPATPGIEVNFDDVRLQVAGIGISAAADFETVAPTAGACMPPASATSAPISIPYAGATDASGLASVELWARTDTSPWAPTGLSAVAPSGAFEYTPPGIEPANHGTYYFALVAEDVRGNRSAAPAGLVDDGDGATVFAAASGEGLMVY